MYLEGYGSRFSREPAGVGHHYEFNLRQVFLSSSTKQLVSIRRINNMKSWIKKYQEALSRRFIIGFAAVAMVLSFAVYEFETPAKAAAAIAPAAAAGPLDDNSVNALLSLNRAMETLA